MESLLTTLESYWHVIAGLIAFVSVYISLKVQSLNNMNDLNTFKYTVDQRINALHDQYERLHRLMEQSNVRIDENLHCLMQSVQKSNEQQQCFLKIIFQYIKEK